MSDEAEDQMVMSSDLKFTLDEFLLFLDETGRSNTCPLCGNSGEWEFMTHEVDGTEYISVYSIMKIAEMFSHAGVAMMTCVKCGFAPMTNMVSVYNHYQGKRK